MWIGVYYVEDGMDKGYLTYETSKKRLAQKLNHVLNDKGQVKEVRIKGKVLSADEFYKMLYEK